ncbi:MAG: HEAT repeat domain-containing protein [Solirubrobacteraceae bacterium]
MQPAAIIAALEAPTEDRRPLMAELREDAPAAGLAAALETAEAPHTRQLLADLLGFQAAPAGVAALIACLTDPELRVRAAAADALGKVFMAHPDDPQAPGAGAALLARWQDEPATAVRHMLAAALGATGHRPAAPVLRTALDDPDAGVRDAAAWALERLGEPT